MIVRLSGGSATGSTLDRAVRCPASVALPQVNDAGDSDARDKGTALHEFLDRVAKVGRDVALSECDEQWREACESINIAKISDTLELSTETAVAYDWVGDTARILKPLEPRAYEIDESREVALTVDVAGYFDGTVYIADFKGPRAWLPAPEQSMQLGVAALAIARIHNASSAIVEYIRLRDDGEPIRWRSSLDLFGLEGVAERVATTMHLVAKLRAVIEAGTVPNVTEGPWCSFCPAKVHCPGKTSLIRKTLSDQPLPFLLPLTPDNAAHAYELWRRAKDALKQVEGALHGYAKLVPIPIGTDEDGSQRWFGELSRPGNETFDGTVVHQVIAELYGGEAANSVVTMESTKSAITNVIRPLAQSTGEPLKSHTDRVFELVRARGGASRKTTTTTTEYTVSTESGPRAKKRRST